MLAPRSIAIVGATDDPTRIGGQVLANVRWGFAGDVFPVSTTRREVQGLRAVASLTQLDVVPDLVIVAVGGDAAHEVVADAARLGVSGVVVLSAGFAETGAEGAQRQRALVETARDGGTRILGPNTIGFIAPRNGVYASFFYAAAQETRLAPIALLTQSGAVAAYLLRSLRAGGIGLSLMCATGNEADLTTIEMIEHVVGETDVRVVLACIESARDTPRLIAVGRRARAEGKRIILLKIGTSAAGARAAESHSGAVSSDAAAFSAALRHAGIVEVDTVAALGRLGPVFLDGRKASGNRLGIISTSGGIGIHLADRAATVGIDVPELSEADRQRIAAVLPSFASPANPVDITGNVVNDIGSLRKAATALVQSDGIDMALVYATAVGPAREAEAFAAIEAAHHVSTRPLLALAHDDRAACALLERGVPAVSDADLAVVAIAALARDATLELTPARSPLPEDHPAVEVARRSAGEGGWLSPAATFELLRAFGIEPVSYAVVSSLDEAAAAAAKIGRPVALKLAAAQLVHKSDVGGVVLNLRNQGEVAEAASRLLAVAARQRLSGELLVQEMAPTGVELFCGAYRAENIGPVVVVGLGGMLVEVVAATETLLASASDKELRAAVERLCGGRLVTHRRGLSPAAVDRLVSMLGAVASLALSVPELDQLDLNPLVVVGDAIMVVDAACSMRSTGARTGELHPHTAYGGTVEPT